MHPMPLGPQSISSRSYSTRPQSCCTSMQAAAGGRTAMHLVRCLCNTFHLGLFLGRINT